ncbi:hypothetical protein GCM10008932_14080 [Alkalibacterium iburiense]|uniref:Malate synthase n=1 Tax=Alkalibacterium iburiense TaxID=290589 RepID=A0ABN0XG61_9LACT
MDLTNQKITHKVFGEGHIVSHNDTILTVKFDNDKKEFVYPDAFDSFISLKDPAVAQSMEKVVKQLKSEEEEQLREEKEERRQKLIIKKQKRKLKNGRLHESSQAVFWLDEEEQETIFSDWEVSTGKVQSGANKGTPSRAARLRPNSAIVLTAREEEQEETERRILGLFMVPETFSGSTNEDGVIPAHSKYRIQLTDEEADKMLFWNYYKNKNYPERTTWNSGKYRYFDNIWVAQMLKDIIDMRTGEEREEVENFLTYFCQVNALDKESITEAEGALKL